MTDKGTVTAIEKGRITVTPLTTESCAACSAACEKNGKTFTVVNPKGFSLKTGDVVEYSARAFDKAVQGIFALFLPFLAAVAGYFLAGPVFSLFHVKAGEGIKAACVLVFLALSCAIVLISTRKHPLPGTPEITAVI